jgi:hypothetical protein
MAGFRDKGSGIRVQGSGLKDSSIKAFKTFNCPNNSGYSTIKPENSNQRVS